MRGMFPGYYRRTDEELERIWRDGIFVMDASVLLNLYRYTEKVRTEFLGILRGVQDRLWIPHQVAEEFHGRRLGVIRDHKDAYQEVSTVLSAARKDVEKTIKAIHKDSRVETGDLLEEVERTFEGLTAKARELEKESGVRSVGESYSPEGDEIWRAVIEVFEGRVGDELAPELKKEVFVEEGPRRYMAEIPPGYMDPHKDGNRPYGDLILWLETIDRARRSRKPVLFVTDDRKEDWWQKTGGRAIEPHPALANEMHREAGVLFHMFLPLDFAKWVGPFLKEEISEETAEEIQELRPLEETRGVVPENERGVSYSSGVLGSVLGDTNVLRAALGDLNLSKTAFGDPNYFRIALGDKPLVSTRISDIFRSGAISSGLGYPPSNIVREIFRRTGAEDEGTQERPGMIDRTNEETDEDVDDTEKP